MPRGTIYIPFIHSSNLSDLLSLPIMGNCLLFLINPFLCSGIQQGLTPLECPLVDPSELCRHPDVVTLGSPRYGQGLLGLADIRSATRLPPQPLGPPGVPLMIWGQ